MNGRIVVIAGAGPGLGRSLCTAFAAAGATVFACARPGDSAALAGVPTRVFENDLTVEHEVDAVASAIERVHGPADVVVYNAGNLLVKPFLEISPEDMRTCYEVNYYGAFLCARRFLPAMVKRGSGTLMFTGASGSLRAVPRLAACVASKQALRGLSETLACEYEPLGIQVSHVVVDGLIWSEKVARALAAEPSACLRADEIAPYYVALAERRGITRCRELVVSAAGS